MFNKPARTPVSANQDPSHNFRAQPHDKGSESERVFSAKESTAVGTATLAHSEAAQNANGEEQNGTKHAQTCKIIFQNTNPACWTSSDDYHLLCGWRLLHGHIVLVCRHSPRRLWNTMVAPLGWRGVTSLWWCLRDSAIPLLCLVHSSWWLRCLLVCWWVFRHCFYLIHNCNTVSANLLAT